MQGSTIVRGALGLLLALVCGSMTVEWAGAVPPPPHFREFTILNSTPVEVTNVEVEFFPSNPGMRGQLGTSFRITLSRLPAGKSAVFSTGPGMQGIEGIARIQASGMCPNGNPLPIPATITAPKQDFDGDGVAEYAGFCSSAPPGQSDYTPMLEFRVNPSTQRTEAYLHAKWRWNAAWPPMAVTDTSTFP